MPFTRPLSLAAVLLASPFVAGAGAQTFARTLGSTADERATWGVPLAGGGFALVGEAQNGTLVALLGADGSVAWARVLQGTSSARVLAGASALWIAAESNVLGAAYGLTWTRVDLAGAPAESHEFPGTPGASNGLGPGFAGGPTGAFVAGARALAPSIPLAPELLALDGSGHLGTVRDYDDVRFLGTLRGEFADVELTGGAALAAGSVGADGEPWTRDAVVGRFAPNGVPTWVVNLGTDGVEDRALALELCADGDVVVAGADASIAGGGAFVARLDPLGGVRWRVELPGFAPTSGLAERVGGELVLAGSSGGDAALVDLGADGTLRWARAYPAPGASRAVCVAPLADGGLFFVGEAGGATGGASDALVARTDPLGRIGCAEHDLALAAVVAPRAGVAEPLVLVEDLGEHARTIEAVSQDLLESTACAVERVRAGCAGDGTLATPCPCANFGGAGRGCANSVEPLGALLGWNGTPAPDTLELGASGLPSLASASVLFFQGDVVDADGVPFGDGLRCAAGTLVRLGAKAAPAGVATLPEAGDPSLSVRGGVAPGSGELRAYQAYYRNAAAAFCPPATFNATNAVIVLW